MRELLQELTKLSGPCGFEHDVARYIYERVSKITDDVSIDGIGNVIAKVNGANDGPSLVVSAHMDEIGFIVKKIEKNGLIRFEKLGGHDDRILLAQKVQIRTENGIRYGVIGTISAHMMKYDNPEKVRKHSELYIDVGVDSKAEVTELGIQIGDPITWAAGEIEFGKNRIIGKGFDDRVGCAILLNALEETDFSNVYGTVYAVFSVQEEVGLRGAKVAGQQIQADLSLAIDTTAVSDTPEAMMDDTLALGKGPGIKVMDFSLIASVSVRKKMIQVAEEQQIPYQLEVFPGIGTDGGAISQSQDGVPTGVISIPSRYAHSPVEVLDLSDIENSKNLLKQFMLSMREKSEFRFI
ncbi:M42 family metallopeptidase [Evansella halocellulosilytica]|uniref:M42 family metallopeptidase n=1 Tax=Evansella halocellulosilytica TaxID=2011013 RepID=UPI000BB7859A|nr:M42 family metallopeptidase [Evansella halocellulosilytica]